MGTRSRNEPFEGFFDLFSVELYSDTVCNSSRTSDFFLVEKIEHFQGISDKS